jgi:hypothetical protein
VARNAEGISRGRVEEDHTELRTPYGQLGLKAIGRGDQRLGEGRILHYMHGLANAGIHGIAEGGFLLRIEDVGAWRGLGKNNTGTRRV